MKRISNFEAQLKNKGINERLRGGEKKEKEENIVKNDNFDNFNEPFKSLNRWDIILKLIIFSTISRLFVMSCIMLIWIW